MVGGVMESTNLLTEDNIAVILVACIPAFVTIIGFIVTCFLNKRNFKEEVNKAKADATLERISDLPYKILTLMDTIVQKNKLENYEQLSLKLFKELMSIFFCVWPKRGNTAIFHQMDITRTHTFSKAALPLGVAVMPKRKA